MNIPNFSLQRNLQYSTCKGGSPPPKGSGRRKGQIPDFTLGLHTYDLRAEPWIERPDLTSNPMVSLWDKGSILRLLKDITCPYDFENKEGIPIFGLAIWEVKPANQSHEQAYEQSSAELLDLLEWQRNAFKKANFDLERFTPMVWFFSSVGSDWRVYACFEGQGRYVSIRSFLNGDSADEVYSAPDKAVVWRCSEFPASSSAHVYC